jgi:hypothetical protein
MMTGERWLRSRRQDVRSPPKSAYPWFLAIAHYRLGYRSYKMLFNKCSDGALSEGHMTNSRPQTKHLRSL